eukprot:1937301-Pleurochrysis_carterae.AAC.1
MACAISAHCGEICEREARDAAQQGRGGACKAYVNAFAAAAYAKAGCPRVHARARAVEGNFLAIRHELLKCPHTST